MTLCAPRRIFSCLAPWCRIASRRPLSTLQASDQTRFSYYLSSNERPQDILHKLPGNAVLQNSKGHNAAVVLATPDFAQQFDDQVFNSELVTILSASGNNSDFHLLCAIVDDIAPALGEPAPLPGISVLRGELDVLLPQLWQRDPPREKFEQDSVAALTFKVGLSTQTLPLTRTTFLNNRASTLLTRRYELSGGAPKLKQEDEKQWQHIQVAIDQPAKLVADFGLWAPLSPVTRARKITESFGNIVRGVEVKGKHTPASGELEDAVNTIFEHRKTASVNSGPMGVWALITPDPSSAGSWTAEDAPDPSTVLEGHAVTRKALESHASYLQQQYQFGSRFYQVLSGGGGWGAKKGLLSLDPRETYFAPSEEEEMEKFMQTMNNSSFAPPGAYIQFFVPTMAPAETTATSATGIVFGVPLGQEISGSDLPEKGYLVADHFGALSTQGIFSSVRLAADATSYHDSKLSVPGSRIYIGNTETKSGGVLGFLGGGGLADAGTIAMM